MKRIILLILVLLFLVYSLSSCPLRGGKASQETVEPTPTAAGSTEVYTAESELTKIENPAAPAGTEGQGNSEAASQPESARHESSVSDNPVDIPDAGIPYPEPAESGVPQPDPALPEETGSSIIVGNNGDILLPEVP